MHRRGLFIMLVFCLSVGCGKKKNRASRPIRLPIRKVNSPARSQGDAALRGPEVGLASWYGNPYHGRRAANGEIYDMEQLTAAHRTLAFNTMVRVQNLENARTVDVRITDRGPFVGGRVIDLSHAAANAIGMIGPGTVRVRLSVVSVPDVVEPNIFGVQVGAFHNRSNADRLLAEMMRHYGAAHLVLRGGEPPLWRVLAGSAATPEAAAELARTIRAERNVPEAFVVRVDEP
ncbi:MAG: septal ring lytic transglycosylase RlpA family protein [Acidobacteriota bacterium]|nr:septal ring lytic transglycosylase RlpA family protein [Acidobacteriota bacterium]